MRKAHEESMATPTPLSEEMKAARSLPVTEHASSEAANSGSQPSARRGPLHTLTTAQYMDVEAERVLAKAAYPTEWAATLALPGEKRRRRQKALRARAVNERDLAPLRAIGLCCGNCPKTGNAADVLGSAYAGKRYCRVDSDHDGYSIIDPTGLCRWHGSRSQADTTERPTQPREEQL
jgi:hypothetical protein